MGHGEVHPDDLERTRVAYEAYRGESNGTSLLTGQRMHTWEQLPTLEKRAFMAALAAAAAHDERLEAERAEAEQGETDQGDDTEGVSLDDLEGDPGTDDPTASDADEADSDEALNYDPGAHTIAQVVEYVDGLRAAGLTDDAASVIDRERAGRGRAGILNH
jgi:hypothetical protein